MAVSQPLSTDKLSAPDHSLMHRIIATDPSAAVESVEVDSGGNLVLAHPLATGQGGTGKTANANAANGVVVNDGFGYLVGDGRNLTNLPAQTPGAASITTTMLKTAIGEVSATGAGVHNLTLPGGTYGFYPQIKTSGAFNTLVTICGSNKSSAPGTTYITNVTIDYSDSGTTYVQQRYVTSSGMDEWIFFLVDKNTKEVISVYQAPDHPAYGNSNDFDKQPHPFPSYNPATQEIIKYLPFMI